MDNLVSWIWLNRFKFCTCYSHYLSKSLYFVIDTWMFDCGSTCQNSIWEPQIYSRIDISKPLLWWKKDYRKLSPINILYCSQKSQFPFLRIIMPFTSTYTTKIKCIFQNQINHLEVFTFTRPLDLLVIRAMTRNICWPELVGRPWAPQVKDVMRGKKQLTPPSV